jgi:hypothetical protein
MSATDPSPEPPFSIEAHGTVLAENIPSADAARRQVGVLARQHPGCRVQALDRYGAVVAEVFEDQEDGA